MEIKKSIAKNYYVEQIVVSDGEKKELLSMCSYRLDMFLSMFISSLNKEAIKEIKISEKVGNLIFALLKTGETYYIRLPYELPTNLKTEIKKGIVSFFGSKIKFVEGEKLINLFKSISDLIKNV